MTPSPRTPAASAAQRDGRARRAERALPHVCGAGARPRLQHNAAPNGFTLIELLVALTGGLFVSLAVFAMARDASRFYQREGRLASATMASVVGFERLRADIARAAFLSSPNMLADPMVCNRPTTPALLADLASLRIDVGANGSPPNATLAANNFSPQKLTLMGSYSSVDEFPIRSVVDLGAGAGYAVYLQINSAAMARLGWNAASSAADRVQLLWQVFAPGRALRVVDAQGRSQFGVITQPNVNAASTEAFITLNAVPALVFRASQSRFCGFKGDETGGMANVVNFIQYDVRNLSTNSNFVGPNPNYADLYAASVNKPGTTQASATLGALEANRTELVRVELDASGQPLVLTPPNVNPTNLEELVAEYAVDLQSSITAVTSNALDPQQTLQQFLPSDDAFVGYTKQPTTGGTPQRVRALRVRLSVRSRDADRDNNIANGVYRIGLGANGSAPFARIRTLQADVMLPNTTNVLW